MYGLVNQALEDFVRQGFGNPAWDRVRQGAGIPEDMFIAMDGYPDETTYKLVGAATEVPRDPLRSRPHDGIPRGPGRPRLEALKSTAR